MRRWRRRRLPKLDWDQVHIDGARTVVSGYGQIEPGESEDSYIERVTPKL